MTEQGSPVVTMNPFADVGSAVGLDLDVLDYLAGFDRDHGGCTEPLWKLERAQEFYEPDVASWRAMMDGEWAHSLALAEGMVTHVADYFRNHMPVNRVRVVEFPITPYLQWEMHLLDMRARAGSPCRVVPAARASAFDPMPELVIFSPGLMYEVLYDEYGGGRGGRRITDPGVVGPCLRAVQELFAEGEDVHDFHRREIVPLPPPSITDEMRAAVPPYAHRTEEFRV